MDRQKQLYVYLAISPRIYWKLEKQDTRETRNQRNQKLEKLDARETRHQRNQKQEKADQECKIAPTSKSKTLPLETISHLSGNLSRPAFTGNQRNQKLEKLDTKETRSQKNQKQEKADQECKIALTSKSKTLPLETISHLSGKHLSGNLSRLAFTGNLRVTKSKHTKQNPNTK